MIVREDSKVMVNKHAVNSWINSRVAKCTMRPMVWEQLGKKTGITERSMGSSRKSHIRPASLPFCFLIE